MRAGMAPNDADLPHREPKDPPAENRARILGFTVRCSTIKLPGVVDRNGGLAGAVKRRHMLGAPYKFPAFLVPLRRFCHPIRWHGAAAEIRTATRDLQH